MKYNIYILYIIVNSLFANTSFAALANAQSKTIATLQNKTKIPVEFPKILPDSGDYQTHLNISANTDSYYVSFDYTSDCYGAKACTIGSFSANKNIQIESKNSYSQNDIYKYINLNNGYSAVFINSCGAYCSAIVQWKINGVVYTVNLKNGTEAETIRIANSVYD